MNVPKMGHQCVNHPVPMPMHGHNELKGPPRHPLKLMSAILPQSEAFFPITKVVGPAYGTFNARPGSTALQY